MQAIVCGEELCYVEFDSPFDSVVPGRIIYKHRLCGEVFVRYNIPPDSIDLRFIHDPIGLLLGPLCCERSLPALACECFCWLCVSLCRLVLALLYSCLFAVIWRIINVFYFDGRDWVLKWKSNEYINCTVLKNWRCIFLRKDAKSLWNS